MNNKVTVIGGSGFVGTNLCRTLARKQQDFEIIDLNMSREFPEKCKIADVRNLQSLRASITGDIVVNLAAVHRDDIRDKSEYQSTNVDGADNVASVCVELGIDKIVFTSSVAVYGFAPIGTTESGAINPFNEYGRTKFEAEERFRAWQSKGERKLIIVRPTVIFGEGNRGNVYNLLNQIARGNFCMVGSGENRKSMAYVGNMIAFLEATLESKIDYGVFNYVDTPNLTMNQLVSQVRTRLHNKSGVGLRMPYWLGLLLGYVADVVAKLSGKNLPISSLRIRKFAASTEFSTNKANLERFTAPFTLEEGIDLTLESDFIKPDPARQIFYTE